MRKRLVFVVVLTVILSAAGCNEGKERLRDSPARTSAALTEQSSGFSEASTETEPVSYPVGKKGDDFILPDAQTHRYTPEELAGLTPEELRLARNEIYARHGRRFKSEDLITYFSGKAWYHASVEADSFDDLVLNQEEKENLELIRQTEELVSVISCPKIGKEEFPKLNGSTATLGISQAIYRLASGASQKEAEAFIKHSKTTQSYLDLLSNWETDLVIAYEPGEDVKQHMSEMMIKPIGRDALVFLANEKNPVKSLSGQQVTGIYSGELTSWKELGGGDRSIKAFARPENSGSQNLMEKLVMKGKPMAEGPKDFVVSEMGELLEKVSAYDNTGDALGYSVYYYVNHMYQKPELRFMAIDGVMPSNDTIRDKSYPYVSDFYAAIRKNEPKDSKAYQLFEWLTSENGQALVNGLGYVGISETVKPLPDILTEDKEVFTAELPLPKGIVILADGGYLYGEEGIGVFDKKMQLQRFIRHVSASSTDAFLECAEDSILPLQDTLSGLYGIYSIKENCWTADPVYDRVFPTKDGFGLEQGTWDKSTGVWSYTYDTANRKGEVISKGEGPESQIWKEQNAVEQEPVYYNEDFGKHYPELLERYSASESDVTVYSFESRASVAVIQKDGIGHYYDMSGKLLFDFDKGLKGGDADYFVPRILSDGMASLTVSASDGRTSRDYVYRDTVLAKELVSNDTDGLVEYIGESFYTRSAGNYIYFYNYQDEPCAKFLEGYYLND